MFWNNKSNKKLFQWQQLDAKFSQTTIKLLNLTSLLTDQGPIQKVDTCFSASFKHLPEVDNALDNRVILDITLIWRLQHQIEPDSDTTWFSRWDFSPQFHVSLSWNNSSAHMKTSHTSHCRQWKCERFVVRVELKSCYISQPNWSQTSRRRYWSNVII